MKNRSIIPSIAAMTLILITFTQTAQLAETEKETPPPGTINFIGKNAFATAKGTFKKWKFTKADFDPANPADATIEIEVDIPSIDTKSKRRDKHLRSADFFDVENHPTATLKFYDIKKATTPNTYTATLDFTMHGIKKTYSTFTFKTTQTNPTKIQGNFTFNRLDFKIGKPKSKNPMSIKNDIPITFSATLPQ